MYAGTMGAGWLLLKPGWHARLLSEKESGKRGNRQTLVVRRPRTPAQFDVPVGVLCVLRVQVGL
jgi:hypothetical protein